MQLPEPLEPKGSDGDRLRWRLPL